MTLPLFYSALLLGSIRIKLRSGTVVRFPDLVFILRNKSDSHVLTKQFQHKTNCSLHSCHEQSRHSFFTYFKRSCWVFFSETFPPLCLGHRSRRQSNGTSSSEPKILFSGRDKKRNGYIMAHTHRAHRFSSVLLLSVLGGKTVQWRRSCCVFLFDFFYSIDRLYLLCVLQTRTVGRHPQFATGYSPNLKRNYIVPRS